MKSLILTLIIVLIAVITATANEQDTLWLRWTGEVKELEFTPDDNYVIAWTTALEFWEVETGTLEFSVPDVKLGGMTPDDKYLVFIQDRVPKLLDWQTREIITGFEPPTFEPNNVKVGNDNNIFMCFNEKDSLFIWSIESKNIEKVFSIETDFIENGEEFVREITDYGFAGNNDDFIFVSTEEENKYAYGHPNKIYRLTSKFYNRNDLTLFDSVPWIPNYKTMNLNRNIIAIDNYKGSIDFYDLVNKILINKILYDSLEVKASDFKFSHNDNIIGIAQNNSCCNYLKLFNLTDKELILDFNSGSWSWSKFSISNDKLIASTGNSLVLYSENIIISTVESIEYYNFTVNPNPSHNYLDVSYKFETYSPYKLSIIDMSGKLIFIIEEGILDNLNYSKKINITSVPNGLYFIRLEYDGITVNKQFIKE